MIATINNLEFIYMQKKLKYDTTIFKDCTLTKDFANFESQTFFEEIHFTGNCVVFCYKKNSEQPDYIHTFTEENLGQPKKRINHTLSILEEHKIKDLFRSEKRISEIADEMDLPKDVIYDVLECSIRDDFENYTKINRKMKLVCVYPVYDTIEDFSDKINEFLEENRNNNLLEYKLCGVPILIENFLYQLIEKYEYV